VSREPREIDLALRPLEGLSNHSGSNNPGFQDSSQRIDSCKHRLQHHKGTGFAQSRSTLRDRSSSSSRSASNRVRRPCFPFDLRMAHGIAPKGPRRAKAWVLFADHDFGNWIHLLPKVRYRVVAKADSRKSFQDYQKVRACHRTLP
jgi:hypothetical protein